MGNDTSADDESCSDGLLEYPHYTRPAELRGWTVPDVLRSGDHAKVARWRRAQSLARTQRERPDLIDARGGITPADQALLDEFDLYAGARLSFPVPRKRRRALPPPRSDPLLQPTNLVDLPRPPHDTPAFTPAAPPQLHVRVADVG